MTAMLLMCRLRRWKILKKSFNQRMLGSQRIFNFQLPIFNQLESHPVCRSSIETPAMVFLCLSSEIVSSRENRQSKIANLSVIVPT